MSKDLSSTLAAYLDRFVFIGRTRYNGKIHDNILNIFEDLDVEDKKGLLRSILRVHRAATTTDSIKENVDSSVAPKSVDSSQEETTESQEDKGSGITNIVTALAAVTFLYVTTLGFAPGDDTSGYEAISRVVEFGLKVFK